MIQLMICKPSSSMLALWSILGIISYWFFLMMGVCINSTIKGKNPLLRLRILHELCAALHLVPHQHTYYYMSGAYDICIFAYRLIVFKFHSICDNDNIFVNIYILYTIYVSMLLFVVGTNICAIFSTTKITNTGAMVNFKISRAEAKKRQKT